MSDKGKRFQLPRPWSISLTAIWKDADGFKKLVSRVKRLDAFRPAGNHVLMPENRWHFTVLAIMRINGYPGYPRYPEGAQTMQEFARQVFEPFRRDKDLLKDLGKEFKPFTAKAYKVQCSDQGTTLQFDCGKDLEAFRNYGRRVLASPVLEVSRLHNISEVGRRFDKEWHTPLLEPILDDRKNYGSEAFGSIARSPCRSEADTERWREKIDPIKLEFNSIRLLISDEMLTNPLEEADDVSIPDE
jgi:hypothetical protein